MKLLFKSSDIIEDLKNASFEEVRNYYEKYGKAYEMKGTNRNMIESFERKKNNGPLLSFSESNKDHEKSISIINKKYYRFINNILGTVESFQELSKNSQDVVYPSELCQGIKKSFRAFFVPNEIHIPHYTITKSQKNHVYVEEVGERGYVLANKNKNAFIEYKTKLYVKMEKEMNNMMCLFLDVISRMSYNALNVKNSPIRITLKGGRALQILAGSHVVSSEDITRLYEFDDLKDILYPGSRYPEQDKVENLKSLVQMDSFDIDLLIQSISKDSSTTQLFAEQMAERLISINPRKLSIQHKPDEFLYKISYKLDPPDMMKDHPKFKALMDIGYGIPKETNTEQYFENTIVHNVGKKRVLVTQTLQSFIDEKNYMIDTYSGKRDRMSRHFLIKALKSIILAKSVQNKSNTENHKGGKMYTVKRKRKYIKKRQQMKSKKKYLK